MYYSILLCVPFFPFSEPRWSFLHPYYPYDLSSSSLLLAAYCDEYVAYCIREWTPDVEMELRTVCRCTLRIAHPDVIKIMQETVFCLLLPGDSASSRRLAEIMLAGCIPVFVGPPYHNMPLSDFVDYRAASIFLNVEEMAEFSKPGQILEEPDHNRAPDNFLDWHWWIPSIDFKEETKSLKLDDLIGYLKVCSCIAPSQHNRFKKIEQVVYIMILV